MLIIARSGSSLWLDPRYWREATELLRSEELQEMPVFQSGTPYEWNQWCLETCGEASSLCCDGRVLSYAQQERWRAALSLYNIDLVSRPDLYSQWFSSQEQQLKSNAEPHPYFEISDGGVSRLHKIKEFRTSLAARRTQRALVSDPADIAWLLNLRGWDIPYSQVIRAYLIVERERLRLFAEPRCCDSSVRRALEHDGVDVCDYREFDTVITEQYQSTPAAHSPSVLCDPQRTSHHYFSLLTNPPAVHTTPLWPTTAKMCKSPSELEGMRWCALQEGVVYATLHWHLQRAHAEHRTLTESELTAVLARIRRERPHYLQESFPPIVAYNSHAALIHYTQSAVSKTALHQGGIVLVDSGAHWHRGTTDITRVFALGEVPHEVRRDYTAVLRAHIALAELTVPAGITGRQVDSVARAVLWEHGDDYRHGTGHGIGFCLNVHEGPLSIGPHAEPIALQEGMVVSNEPGLYRPGRYGVRIENMMAVRTTPNATMRFEILSPCHLDSTLVDVALLTTQEKKWYTSYQSWVYRSVHPHLPSEIDEWLREFLDYSE